MNAAALAVRLRKIEPEHPFYWTRITNCATDSPSGWYQWTESGLRFLGENLPENFAMAGRDPISVCQDLCNVDERKF